MNLKEIKEIVNLMKENDLAEIEVEREGSKLKIRKSLVGGVEMIPQAIVPHSVAHHAPMPTPAAATPPSSGKEGKKIASPMVGTFYRAPSPEAPPFVEIGQVVEVGQVVCIVEAMKLMNEIKAEVEGKIVEVVVENAEPVEFGQALFVLEPA